MNIMLCRSQTKNESTGQRTQSRMSRYSGTYTTDVCRVWKAAKGVLTSVMRICTSIIICMYCIIQTCLQLLRMGVNVNAANQEGVTPLLIAAALEYDDIIKVLLK